MGELHRDVTTATGVAPRTNCGAEVRDDIAEHVRNFFPEVTVSVEETPCE